ncbi:exopolysaccharide biosynthesis polyprenyl glycosylphosphotransferase [Streptomyces sp. NBC_01498]|uniref:sugar transferase n=1 Tax=Streptomyces sp. NBC_01498 TaxID=2975870 RepID=UPI002E7AC8BA|nr:exopolysaccharide biosynthesis polyprenyl glycosylphosphotransferase [Streptomyces sp. NBC_01498]WTL26368.1 exopolysaccharide biosynthesis polyprenyl glycosylphosphotransferase [Streptomyces sp. NBC_01498]
MTTESTSVPAPSGRGPAGLPAPGHHPPGAGPRGRGPAVHTPVPLTAQRPTTAGTPAAHRPTSTHTPAAYRPPAVTAPGRPPRGLAPVPPRRDTPDRLALPPGRRTAAPLRHALPLLTADWAGALLSTLVLRPEQRHAVLVAALVAGVTVLHTRAGLHRPAGHRTALDELPALAARTVVTWCAAAALLAALLPAHPLSLGALLAGSGAQLLVTACCRAAVHAHRRRTAPARLSSTLVVGTGQAGRRLAALLARHPEYGLRPVGIVAPPREDGATAPRGDERPSGAHPDTDTPAPSLPVLTTTEEIHRAVVRNGVRQAVFAGPVYGGGSGTRPAGGDIDRSELVALFHAYGCATWFVGGGRSEGGMPDHVWGHACRRVDPPATRRGTLAKRLLDIAVAGPVLVVISPVLLVCALAVRFLDGPGVLFRQERVGQHGRTFTLLKFRTLRPADDHEAATRWSVAGDRRMSLVGHLLRRTSMDELPQVWNVLRGDMSLVGPRPERPFFVADFSRTHPGYAARHRMPVGITGLAQVHGLRGDTSIEDRSRFDNHYIDHWSLWQDVCLIIRTALSLVRPAGS